VERVLIGSHDCALFYARHVDWPAVIRKRQTTDSRNPTEDLPNTDDMTPAGKSVTSVSCNSSQKTSRTDFEIQDKYDNNRILCRVVPQYLEAVSKPPPWLAKTCELMCKCPFTQDQLAIMSRRKHIM
jgi:hypothetical protein